MVSTDKEKKEKLGHLVMMTNLCCHCKGSTNRDICKHYGHYFKSSKYLSRI